MTRHNVFRALKILPFGVAFVAMFGFVVMGLWNWLMPALFGSNSIGYWQAFGLLVLSRILFGGFRGVGGRGEDWRRRMMERCEQMTPEEREKFRQRFQSRWGGVAPPEAKPGA
jgi:hypothetical protein